jgi:hypothetical protein
MPFLKISRCLLVGALAAPAPAAAGGMLEARYEVTYTGVTIGQGALVIEVTDDGYSAAGSAAVTGVLQVVTAAKGTVAARGQLVDGKVVPISYSVTSDSKDKSQEIRLAGSAGALRDILVVPPPKDSQERVPVTDEHRVGALDPLSALLMIVPGTGDPTGPEACNRTLPIYDGRERYDLLFTYERSEVAKGVKGYSGPLVVCRVTYVPVSGHRTSRKQVKELSENRNIFVTLAPIAGTRAVVPLRVTFGSVIGIFTMQAMQFSSAPKPRAAADPAPIR